MLSDLANLQGLQSIEGTELFVSLGEDNELYVEEARIVRGDIKADNGVVHLVDLVILPPSDEVLIVDASAGFVGGSAVGLVAAGDGDAVFDYEAYAQIDEMDDSVAV